MLIFVYFKSPIFISGFVYFFDIGFICYCLINVGAVPRKILEYMRNCGVQNITRAIVASHLQVDTHHHVIYVFFWDNEIVVFKYILPFVSFFAKDFF